MASAPARSASVLSLEFPPCIHYKECRKFITSVQDTSTFSHVFNAYHSAQSSKEADFTVHVSEQGQTNIHGALTVGEVVHNFSLRSFTFICKEQTDSEVCELRQHAEIATKKAVNAFELLMAGGRSFPDKKQKSAGVKDGLTRKDELYNTLIDTFFKQHKLDIPKPVVETEGSYVVQVLCNALWYITNQHMTINDAACDREAVTPIPAVFDGYQGFNELKRKKLKQMPVDAGCLKSHAETLYSVLLKPVTSSTAAWRKGSKEIQGLADCLDSYSKYLETKNEEMQKTHAENHPARTIAEDATIEHRKPTAIVKQQYLLLDAVMKGKEVGDFLFFNEKEHAPEPFIDSKQKYRFLKNLQLSVPVDILKFCPGGSTTASFIISKTSENRTESQILVQGARLLQTARSEMQEYHTREMKKGFKEKINNITTLSPSVVEYIYKELAFDGSQTTNPIMQERLRLISLGHTDLIADLRHTNPGRPNTKFDVFFEKLQDALEDITAADDRRHGNAHLSEFISVSDMIQRAASACPPGTPVPSASLVKLQFAPRNPYCQGALNFTSRLNVQFKIQRRQLRTTHPDSHFCNAQLKYLKSFAVEEAEQCMMVCCDDKAKVPIGDPGTAVSTGVRGKKSIVPTSSTLVALDHDMTRCSLTPSVVLQCQVPKSVDKSFVRGKVFTVLNDSVFQPASPFRHAAFLSKMMQNSENLKPILLKFTDGGVDQRNTLEAVKLANVCLFKEFNLDLLIHARCAPGHSYTNPAERVMSILNLGLQNVSLERTPCEKKIEDGLKNKNSMAEIRTFHEENPNLGVRKAWTESLEEVKRTIQNRFIRLKLKDEPIQVLDPLSDEDIEVLKRHLKELFPEMDLTKLQKTHTKKVKSYQAWMDRHCKCTQYVFQIKKCEDVACCIPPKSPLPSWLPDPQLDATGDHYLPYSEVRGQETTEKDRPTLKLLKEKKKKPVPIDSTENTLVNTANQEESTDGQECSTNMQGKTSENIDLGYIEEPQSTPSLCTVQNARSLVECVECRKPRVIYSKHKLTERQQYSIVCGLSELDYTCGSPLLPPSNPLYKSVMARSNITCESPLELAYYRSGLGHANLCSYCCGEGEVKQELLQRFKTVLPICESCILLGKDIITQRPYGKC